MSVVILEGDVFERLAGLADESMDCVVTSPPYWGLRDYGVEGQLGLEATLGEHLDTMVRLFAEIHRVLKSSGTLWLNYGDCYATSPNGRSAADTKAKGDDDRGFVDKPFSTIQGSMKPKDLCMIPNRLAIALQEAGWWVRSEIIWAKPNPMPESIKDRPATSHEKIWLLTKAPKYFYDNEEVKQGVSPNTHARVSQDLAKQEGSWRANGGGKTNGPMRAVVAGSTRKLAKAENDPFVGQKESREAALSLKVDKRNLRNYEPAPVQVWNMATRPFKDAHFATFPPELVERCLKAGCPPGGNVLDPFGGAGTTGLVASRLGLDCTLIELNPEYIEIARNRISEDLGPLMAATGDTVSVNQLQLFGDDAP